MGKFTQNGVIYEELPDGNVRVAGYEQAPATVAANPAMVAQRQRENSRADEQLAVSRRNSDLSAQSGQRDAATTQNTLSNTKFDNVSTFRKEFDALAPVKEYKSVVPILMQGLQTAPTAPGDASLIYAYAKIMDPGSVVRESEGEAAANTAGYWASQVEKYKKDFGFNDARGLPSGAAQGLRLEMNRKVAQMAKAYGLERGRYQTMAGRYGFNPDDVVGPAPGAPFIEKYKKIVGEDHPNAIAPSFAGAGSNLGAPTPGTAGGGDRYSTPDDIALQQKLTAAYRQNAPLAALNQISVQAGRGPLSKEWQDAVTSRDGGQPYREGAPPESGVAGMVRGAVGSDTGAGYDDSILSQGLSGLNQGMIANTLGAPVDLANMALGAGAAGINAIANTDLQVSDKPFLGSDYIADILKGTGSIRRETENPYGQFARRTAESVGGAVLPVAGVETSAARIARALIPSLAGGVGAATAQQVAPGNPYAEIAGELLGTLGGGYGVARAGQRAAQQGIEAAIPTVPQLKTQAGGLYDLAEANGVTASPADTRWLADTLRTFAGQEGLTDANGAVLSAAYPKASQALQMADSFAGGTMSPKQMQTFRKVLGDARNSTEGGEGRIAGAMLNQFDDWTAPLAPELANARDVSSRYLQAQELEKARKAAEIRAGQFSQSGMENALRTDYRALERADLNGRANFHPDVQAAIENVSRGTPAANAARYIGKFAPKGPVSAIASVAAPAGIGASMGSPVLGGAASALLSGGGLAGAAAAEKMTNRAATLAELIARNGGSIPQAELLTPELRRAVAAGLFGQGGGYLTQNEVQ